MAQDNREQSRAVATRADRELLDLACAVQVGEPAWAAEFAWLLRHPAVGPVTGPGEAPRPLGLRTLCAQRAACFPRVSADAAWLAAHSVPVVARRLAPLLAEGHPVCLDLTTLNRDGRASAPEAGQLQLVASGLADGLPGALARYGVAADRLLFSVAADHPGLGHLLNLRNCSALGRPRLVMRLPDRLMLALGGADSGATANWPGDPLASWLGLTGLAHREPGLHLVLQHTTRPACALAGNERADAVLPVSLFEAGADTAWPALQLAVDALQAGTPAQALCELRRVLRAALRLADNVVDQLDWPSHELAQDALINRRLAIHVTGIGDLVDCWKLDPAAFPTVSLVVRWTGLLRRLLLRESNALARERGPFPGLELRDIESTLARSFGAARATRLLRRAGLRNRHLLVLSPYALLPRAAPRRPLPAYLHLLPALRWADTVAMHGDGMARALPAAAFRRLLRTSWAIARNRP